MVAVRTVTTDHRRRVVRDIYGVRVVLLLLWVMMLLMQQLVVMVTTAVTVAAAATAADKNVLHTPTGSDRRDAAVVILEARIIVVQREIVGTMQLLMVLQNVGGASWLQYQLLLLLLLVVVGDFQRNRRKHHTGAVRCATVAAATVTAVDVSFLPKGRPARLGGRFVALAVDQQLLGLARHHRTAEGRRRFHGDVTSDDCYAARTTVAARSGILVLVLLLFDQIRLVDGLVRN